MVTNEELAALLMQLGTPIQSAPISFRPIRPTLPIQPAPPLVPLPPVNIDQTTSPTNGADPSGKNGIPLKLLSVSAVQTPVNQQSYVNSNITVNFTQNPQDQNFFAVQIWFVGYHGSSEPVLMATGYVSPVNFLCDATKETVSVYAQTVSSTGLRAPVLFATHTTVTLSGTVGAPPAPTISQSLVGTPIGYQFGFNQVILPTNDVEVITNYNIYRAILNNTADAALLGTVVSNPNLTGAITYTDTIVPAAGVEYFYWVSAVNSAGFESTLTPAQSGGVVGSIGSLPPSLSTPFKIVTTTSSVTISTSPSCYFTRSDGTKTIIGQTSQAITGLPMGNVIFAFPYWDEPTQTLKFVQNTDVAIPGITGITCPPSGSPPIASSMYVKTTTSASIPAAFSVEMWVMGTVTGALFDHSAPQTIGTTTSSVAQAYVTTAGEVKFSIWNGATWASVTTAGAGILDSTWHHIVCSYGAGVGTVIVDGIYTSDGLTYWQNNSMGTISTTAGYWHFGVVAGFAGAPTTVNTYQEWTMTHVAVYATALNYVQAAAHLSAECNLGEAYYLQELTYDGATNLWKLADTSGTTAVDSIGTNTGTYVGSPTLNVFTPVVTVLGTPLIGWPFKVVGALQQQYLKNHVPFGTLTASTATAGTGGGGGGGTGGGPGRGGGGSCFTGATLVLTERGDIRIDEIKVGDMCLTARGTWRPVLAVHYHAPEPRTMHRMKQGLVTHDHKMLVKGGCSGRGGWVKSGDVFGDTVEVNEPLYTLSMFTSESLEYCRQPDTEHSFTLSNGTIVANGMVIKE